MLAVLKIMREGSAYAPQLWTPHGVVQTHFQSEFISIFPCFSIPLFPLFSCLEHHTANTGN